MKAKCKCGKIATWCLASYPGEEFETIDKKTGKIISVKSEDCGIVPFACDECVPRGYSCWHNPIQFEHEDEIIPNPPEGFEGKDWEWIEKDKYWNELDDEGNQMPCCEWWYNEKGWSNE